MYGGRAIRAAATTAWAWLTTVSDPEREVDRMRTLSRLLDSAIRIPGTNYRIGADSLVGVLPVAGDLVTACVSLYIPYRSVLLGVPYRTVGRMLVNVGLDAAAGSVPVAGDVFDAAWKANERNLVLVERWYRSLEVE